MNCRSCLLKYNLCHIQQWHSLVPLTFPVSFFFFMGSQAQSKCRGFGRNVQRSTFSLPSANYVKQEIITTTSVIKLLWYHKNAKDDISDLPLFENGHLSHMTLFSSRAGSGGQNKMMESQSYQSIKRDENSKTSNAKWASLKSCGLNMLLIFPSKVLTAVKSWLDMLCQYNEWCWLLPLPCLQQLQGCSLVSNSVALRFWMLHLNILEGQKKNVARTSCLKPSWVYITYRVVM